MRLSVSAAFTGLALVLSGCAAVDSRPNQGPCPAAGSLYEAQRVVKLDGQGDQYSNIRYTGEITGVSLFCRYVEDNPITAAVDLEMSFGRGAQATSDTETYNVFVAVTRTNRAVMEKQIFPIEVRFPRGVDVVTRKETIGRIVIPRADSTISGANFEVLVGFELTEEERAFNEGGRRYLLQTQ